MGSSNNRWPKCHMCKGELKPDIMSADSPLPILRELRLIHPYNNSYGCGWGFSKPANERFRGICIPKHCSKCGGYWNSYTGHIFNDHLTTACGACMWEFERWKNKQKSQSVQLSPYTIASNYYVKHANKQVKFYNYVINKFDVGKVCGYSGDGKVIIATSTEKEVIRVWPDCLEKIASGKI